MKAVSAPVAAITLGLPVSLAPLAALAALIGGLGFALTGALGAALALGSKRGGLLIAVVVLLFGAALIVGGVASMVVEPNLVTLLLGTTTVLLGVLMRPRLPRRPPGAVLDPAHTPTLHALVARIAELVAAVMG